MGCNLKPIQLPSDPPAIHLHFARPWWKKFKIKFYTEGPLFDVRFSLDYVVVGLLLSRNVRFIWKNLRGGSICCGFEITMVD